MNRMIRLFGFAALLTGLQVSAAEAQLSHPPPPHPSIVVGEASTVATVTVPGGRLIELAGLRGGTVRMLGGITRKEVNRLLGSPMYTSLLRKAGMIDFDSEGRLIPGPALETGSESESGGENGKRKRAGAANRGPPLIRPRSGSGAEYPRPAPRHG